MHLALVHSPKRVKEQAANIIKAGHSLTVKVIIKKEKKKAILGFHVTASIPWGHPGLSIPVGARHPPVWRQHPGRSCSEQGWAATAPSALREPGLQKGLRSLWGISKGKRAEPMQAGGSEPGVSWYSLPRQAPGAPAGPIPAPAPSSRGQLGPPNPTQPDISFQQQQQKKTNNSTLGFSPEGPVWRTSKRRNTSSSPKLLHRRAQS